MAGIDASLIDALPYIDQGYDDPGVREAALAMVEEEMRRYRPTKNYLEHLPPLNINSFETDIMKHEYERMQNRTPMEVLSMKRYELPPPIPGKMNDLASWNESSENSSAQLEHQATRKAAKISSELLATIEQYRISFKRDTMVVNDQFIRRRHLRQSAPVTGILNMELMIDYGCPAWQSSLKDMLQQMNQAQEHSQTIRKLVQEVNWQRKSTQTQGGEKLRSLESRWVGLVSKNYEIEQACVHLEKELHKSMISKQAETMVNVPDEQGQEEEQREPALPEVPEATAEPMTVEAASEPQTEPGA